MLPSAPVSLEIRSSSATSTPEWKMKAVRLSSPRSLRSRNIWSQSSPERQGISMSSTTTRGSSRRITAEAPNVLSSVMTS